MVGTLEESLRELSLSNMTQLLFMIYLELTLELSFWASSFSLLGHSAFIVSCIYRLMFRSSFHKSLTQVLSISSVNYFESQMACFFFLSVKEDGICLLLEWCYGQFLNTEVSKSPL